MDFVPPDNDFSPNNLEAVTDHLYLNLYDEIFTDMVQDDRFRDRRTMQRQERNWLGTLTIPFSTIYEHGKIEGNFHVRVPIICHGYQRDPGNAFLGFKEHETLLNLFITLEPHLPQPPTLRTKVSVPVRWTSFK